MAQWVQSKYSTDAPKWEVEEEYDNFYCVRDEPAHNTYYLPKSEYTLCDPSIVWEVCTREVVQISTVGNALNPISTCPINTGQTGFLFDGYRWDWDGDALVIKRKVQG